MPPTACSRRWRRRHLRIAIFMRIVKKWHHEAGFCAHHSRYSGSSLSEVKEQAAAGDPAELVLSGVRSVLLDAQRPPAKKVRFPLIVSKGPVSKPSSPTTTRSMSTLNFLDANVWLALLWGRHLQAERALNRFEEVGDQEFFFCRLHKSPC